MTRTSNTPRRGRVAGCVAFLLAVLAAGAATASAATWRTVVYRGVPITVPASWPVLHLGRASTTCVRFDRHALYLGTPGATELCPAHAAGRTEAILAEPSSGAATALRPGSQPGASGSEARVALGRRVVVTATWGAHRAVVEKALGRTVKATVTPVHAIRSLATRFASGGAGTSGGAGSGGGARAAAASIYTGLGFDACGAPSAAAMSAWALSPYRGVGIYVGGQDMACSQTNLTASWVATQIAAGWHLIPTYVGLQAPSNSCGCSGFTASNAVTQATTAADDAVAQMQALGLGPGNPVYYDMEAYPTGGKNTSAVLTYLAAWTTELHAAGYLSGVYSSGASGIADLAAQWGTSYLEPDELWVADWNGLQSVTDPYVPALDWPSHQRVHQFSGSHNATYGNTTLNIDGDYVDGATAGTATPITPDTAPSLVVRPAADGTIGLSASWPGVSTVARWQVLGGYSIGSMIPIGSADSSGSSTPIVTHSAFTYFAVQALDAGSQLLGVSPTVQTPAHLAIYGRNAYVPVRGLAGVPVGCFTGVACRVTATITSGRTVMARTGAERVPANGSGLVFFKLTPAGRAKLGTHRIAVKLTIADASGIKASTAMTLISFATSGRSPRRAISSDPTLRIVGGTDFVSFGGTGGILAGCVAAAPCDVSTQIRAHGVTIAQTGQEFLGAGAVGYLIFRLTPQGRSLLAHAPGNQLGAHVVLRNGNTTANADLVLVRAG